MTSYRTRRRYLLVTATLAAGAVAGCLSHDGAPTIQVSNMASSSETVSIDAYAVETDRELVSETVTTEPKGAETQHMIDIDIEERTEIRVTAEIEADSDAETHNLRPAGNNWFGVTITEGHEVDVSYGQV